MFRFLRGTIGLTGKVSCHFLWYVMFDLTKHILSYSFEYLKDFSHVQVLFFSAISRVIHALITRYICVFESIRSRNKTLLQFRTGSYRGKSALKIIKGYGINRKILFLVPGADHFQIQKALYWFKLRHKPKHIQKLQQVTN